MMTSLERAIRDISDKESGKTLIREIIFFKNPRNEWEYRVAYFFRGIEATIWVDSVTKEYKSKGIEYMIKDDIVSFK